MKDLMGKVAVVTGAGSGIGKAIAHAAADHGMSVAVADINIANAQLVVDELYAKGVDAIAVDVDVSDIESVRRLRDAAISHFGAVHLLCNNAGVWVGAHMAEADIRDWRYLIDVNLYGVINGVNVFLPDMIAQGTGHIVNTSSMGGLVSGPPEGLYCTTKFAIVGLSESLLLESVESGVGVSVLCPGLVNTNLITSSSALRPSNLSHDKAHKVAAPDVKSGLSPEEIGRRVLDAVLDDEFYIIPHSDFREILMMRHQGIIDALDRQVARYE